MQNEMIYLTYNEYVERLVKAKRHANQLPHNPNQSLAEWNAEGLFQSLPYLLGTDRQEYHVERIIRYLKIYIKEKVNANDILNK